jgi:amino acid permease
MLRTRSSFLPAFLLLVGTIIGAGVFGVPLVFSRMGIVTGSIVFWVVAALVAAAHLLFVEVIARDHERRRLPGYVGQVFGKTAESLAVLSHALHLIGANLAYILLGGEFLYALMAAATPFDVFSWQLLFWVGGIVTVLAGLKVLSRVESTMAWVEIGSMALIALIACFFVRTPIPLETHWSEATIGLGVFVFALSGLTVIPEVHELTGKRIHVTRRVTLYSSALTAFLTWLFGVGVYLAASHDGQLGSATAIASILPGSIAWLLPLFGFFAVATSYLTTAYDLRSMYLYDLKWRPWIASVLALATPFVLLVFLSRDFFQTIDVVGAVFSASNAFLIAITAYVVMQRSSKKPPFWWRTVVPGLAAGLFGFVMIQRLLAWGVH